MSKGIFRHLLNAIPGGKKIRRASVGSDRNGTDYWIDRDGLPSVSVDVKHRAYCPIEKFGTDDACIEVCSVYRGVGPPYDEELFFKSPGWTLNSDKRTDLIVYTWPGSHKSLRYWILYFPFLCRAAIENWQRWSNIYGLCSADNPTYKTLSVYPPRPVIADAMRHLVLGVIPRGVPNAT